MTCTSGVGDILVASHSSGAQRAPATDTSSGTTSGILVRLVIQISSVVIEYAAAAHTAQVWSAPPL
jgi:hypothetical protein